jgi:hypothetical protein
VDGRESRVMDCLQQSKNLLGYVMPKTRTLTKNPITSEIQDTMQKLSDDISDECIMAIKNKQNNQTLNNNQGI